MSTQSDIHRPAAFASTAPSPYLTRRQTAGYLNVSEKWLAQSGRTAGPSFHKFGNHCRYHIDDIRRWARQQEVRR